jgi:hypothetical protein
LGRYLSREGKLYLTPASSAYAASWRTSIWGGSKLDLTPASSAYAASWRTSIWGGSKLDLTPASSAYATSRRTSIWGGSELDLTSNNSPNTGVGNGISWQRKLQAGKKLMGWKSSRLRGRNG